MKKTTPTYQELKEKIKSLEKENLLLKLNAKIFDASPAYIVLISPVGKVLAMNESMLQVLGYTAKQVLGVNYIETFIPEQDRAELTALFTKHANVEETAVNINRVLKKDGKTITVEWHGTPFFDKENNLHAYLGIGIDITDKIEAEKLVQKNAIQLKTIVKNYPGGSISLIDKDLKIIFTGGTGYKKHNLNPEVFDGKHIKHAFIPEMYEINEPYLQKCLEGKISEFIVEYQQTFYKNYTYPIVVNNKIEYALLISNDISDLKKHENDLLKALNEQNIILNNDPAFIIFKDNKNNILRISETVAKMTGLQKHEIEGKPSKAIYPDMAEKYYADDLEVMKNRKPKRGIIEPLPSVKGEQKWLMTDKVPYFDDNGEVAGIIVFSTDITEIKETEESLIKAKEKAERSEEKFKLLNRFTSEMLLLQDLKSIYKFIADTLEKLYPNTIILNNSIDESAQQSRLETISGLDKNLLEKVIKASGFNPIGRMYKLTDVHNNYFKSGKFIEFDGGLAEFSALELPALAATDIEKLVGLHKIYTIGINKDNELLAAIHFLTLNKNVITDGNFIEVFVKQAGLVLQKKINEKALTIAKEKAEESEQRLKLASNSAELGIWDLDVENNILLWDDRMYELYGVENKSDINTVDVWKNGLHPDDKEQAIKEFEEAVKRGTIFNTDFRVLQPSGKVLYIKGDGLVLRDSDGKAVRMIGINRDITASKLNEIKLQRAKEKAEESDRLKSAFLANMSHEIRTPMNGVLGFTDLLKEPNLSGEEQQRYIDIIQKSGNRMLNTINDIIEISRIEAGEMRINSVKVNINKHLLTIKNFFSLEAEKKGIIVLIDNNITDEDLFIVTDKAKLSSILTNLIKNAIKFTKKGEIRIGCKQDNTFLEFYIKDSGIGIPKDRKDAIFNRFEQADIEDKEAHQGSGLGLTISKSYVEMLGGKIWVESEENKGSTFFFTIPFDTPKCETESKQTIPIQAKSIVKKLNLLIVEDDSISAYYLTTVLKDKAENIQIAKDGLEAVEVCKNNPKLDLILMDVKLPGIDGLEATRRIRGFNKNVKIIAQTAHAIEGDKEKAIKAGCDDYISKPISKDNLFKHIEKATNTE